jgi:hypothetical protein
VALLFGDAKAVVFLAGSPWAKNGEAAAVAFLLGEARVVVFFAGSA